MDNLSHSITGLAAGELIHRSLPPEPDALQQRIRRHVLLFACFIASNFPDLDLILTPLLQKPLGYLLHHRGHTHTILYAIPQALLAALLIYMCWPAARRLLKASRHARQGLAWALAAGLLLHLAMDYLNNYGVHPFHPFVSQWFYGDMVFIVEPFFWVAFGIPLAMSIRRAGLRWLLAACLLGMQVYFTYRGFLAWGSLALLLAMAGAVGWLQRRAGERGRSGLILAALLTIAFVGMQSATSGLAKDVVGQHLAQIDPASRTVDIALTAFPTNPLCWHFVSLETREDEDSYRLRRGQLSLAPGLLPLENCPIRFSEHDKYLSNAPAFALIASENGSLSWLRTLKAGNCHFEAWLRFARMPWLEDSTATDRRFPSNGEGNFTTMKIKDFNESKCSQLVPKWEFPRKDLLAPLPRTNSN